MSTRILIAEDDPIQRMELNQMLTEQGYLVVGEAADGQSVVDLVSTLHPDLVLMDIRLPGQDGISTAAMLRQQQLAPVVLLSAFSGGWFIEKAKDAGVLNYLVKPLRESEVVPAIEVALARDKDRRAQEEQARLLSEQLETRKRADRERGFLLEKQRWEDEKRRWEEGEWWED